MSIQPLEPEHPRRMSNAEAVALCRYAKAACPQQQFDEFTPDAWADLLCDLRFEDCREALRAIVKRQPFVAPAEIREEVKRVRSGRIGKFGPLPSPPSGLSDADYRTWHVALIRRIGDGEITDAAQVETAGELIQRDVKALIAGVPERRP